MKNLLFLIFVLFLFSTSSCKKQCYCDDKANDAADKKVALYHYQLLPSASHSHHMLYGQPVAAFSDISLYLDANHIAGVGADMWMVTQHAGATDKHSGLYLKTGSDIDLSHADPNWQDLSGSFVSADSLMLYPSGDASWSLLFILQK